MVGRPPRTLADRFWEKVDRGSNDECWDWLAHRSKSGYGRIRVRRGVQVFAHRQAYELVVGPIPDGLFIDHLCRNRACCNPSHMEPVTARENVLRGDSLVARNAAKDHCIRGHPFDEANTYEWRSKSGSVHRQCRQCKAEHHLRNREKGA